MEVWLWPFEARVQGHRCCDTFGLVQAGGEAIASPCLTVNDGVQFHLDPMDFVVKMAIRVPNWMVLSPPDGHRRVTQKEGYQSTVKFMSVVEFWHGRIADRLGF